MTRAIVLAFAAASVSLAGARLASPTSDAFDAYIRQAESHMDQRALDRLPAVRARVLGGEIAALPFADKAEGRTASIPIRDGLINHWFGAMYLPGASVDQVRAVLQNYPNYTKTYPQDITESKLLKNDGSDFDIFLRMSRIVKVKALLGYSFPVEFNTTFHVRYTQSGESVQLHSIATRIAEVKDPKKSHTEELPPGDDSGYLWRLNSYWRVYPVQGGVVAECEAISLSRSVPGFVEKMVTYFTTNFPEDSMRSTLKATKAAVVR